jgi:hypothetical protein
VRNGPIGEAFVLHTVFFNISFKSRFEDAYYVTFELGCHINGDHWRSYAAPATSDVVRMYSR